MTTFSIIAGLIPTAIAIASGILVLLGYFVRLPFLNIIRIELLRWAVILAAFAILVGIVESVMARLRLTRVPQMLVGASVLSVFALVLLLR